MIPVVRYWHKLLFFAALSVMDLYLTWLLWQQGGEELLSHAYPLAYQCVADDGVMGFMVFQLILMFLVGVLFAISHRFQPRISEGGLSLLCLILSSVVVYRCCLFYMPPDPAQFQSYGAPMTPEVSPTTHKKIQPAERYSHFVRFWADQVVWQRCTLPKAARQVQQSEKARNGQLLAHLRRTHGREYSDEACYAINVLLHCAARLLIDKDRSRARARAASLQSEFKAAYGVEVPLVFKERILPLEPACNMRPRILIRPYPDYESPPCQEFLL